MRWYFLTDNQEQVPTSEEQIVAYAGQGILRPHHLIWHEGQADWKSLGEMKPELFSAGPAFRSDAAVGKRVGKEGEFTPDGFARYVGWMIALAIVLEVVALVFLLDGIATWREMWRAKDGWNASGPAGASPQLVATSWLVALGVMSSLVSLLLAWTGILLSRSASDLLRGKESGQAFLKERGKQRLGQFSIPLFFAALMLGGWVLLMWKIGALRAGLPPSV